MLERTVFQLYRDIYPPTQSTPSLLLDCRYIDDILLCTTSRNHADTLLNLLNNMHPTIHITYVVSNNSVNFLDLTIHKNKRFYLTYLLDIKPYQKPMNAYLYNPSFSNHNRCIFKSFIQSKIRRYTLLSTTNQYTLDICKQFYLRLLARGYPTILLDDAFSVTYHRNDILFPPHIITLYGTRYTSYHPRDSAHFPFNPPYFATTSTDDTNIAIPTIFKLPYTSTYTISTLRKILSYEPHLRFEPHFIQNAIININTYHPKLCFTRTDNIGDLLNTSKYNNAIPNHLCNDYTSDDKNI